MRAAATKSPFPGMDPFVEACNHWGDFHEKLIGELERDLSARIPERYVVRLAKRTYIELTDPEDEFQWMVPDVGIAQRPKRLRKRVRQRDSGDAGVTILERPVTMRALIDTEYQESYLEIHEAGSPRRLVTAIEVLSPANKRPGSVGWRQYIQKRQIMLHGAANFVEIDLLRGGERMPMLSDWPDSPYYMLVASKKEPGRCLAWPAFSVRPIPTIAIPLLPSDKEIELRLQPLIDEVYRRSRYDIDYQQPITLPLSAEEWEHVFSRRKQTGRRSRS